MKRSELSPGMVVYKKPGKYGSWSSARRYVVVDAEGYWKNRSAYDNRASATTKKNNGIKVMDKLWATRAIQAHQLVTAEQREAAMAAEAEERAQLAREQEQRDREVDEFQLSLAAKLEKFTKLNVSEFASAESTAHISYAQLVELLDRAAKGEWEVSQS